MLETAAMASPYPCLWSVPVRGLVDERYGVVAEVGGHPVWLRRDLTREPAAPPAC